MDLGKLKKYQQKIIYRLIGKYNIINDVDLPSEISKYPIFCRECGHEHFVKNGHYNEKQRYKCKKCNTTQFTDANTALYNLKLKDKWIDFVSIMLDDSKIISCKAISKELDISGKTAHQWRHKMLSCLNEFHSIEIGTEQELDEVYFRFCVKGRIGREKYDRYIKPNHPKNTVSQLRKDEIKMIDQKFQAIYMCQHNRNQNFEFQPIKIQKKGIVSEEDIKRVLKDMDFKNKTVITDSESSLIAYFKKQDNSTHLTFKSSDIKKGILKDKKVHNNNINNTMMLLRDWMKKFKGVSTKYLGNYLKWFRLKKMFNIETVQDFVDDYATDKTLYPRFLNIFQEYKKLVYLC